MSPARTPTDKLDAIAAGIARLEGRLEGIDERVTRVEEASSELRERAAKSEDAYSRLDKRNDSATEASLKGYRQITSDMAEIKARQEHPPAIDGIMEEFEKFKDEVRLLTQVAQSATPEVVDAVAQRVNETAAPDRRKIRATTKWWVTGGSIAAVIVPAANFISSHPHFAHDFTAAFAAGINGLAKVIPS